MVSHSLVCVFRRWTWLLPFPIEQDYHGWPFGDTATPIINVLIRHLYLVFLLIQFIVALGNRPKATRHTYVVSFLIFGMIQGYIIVLSFYLVYRACAGFSQYVAIICPTNSVS